LNAEAALKDYAVNGKPLKRVSMSLGRAGDDAFVFEAAEMSFEAGQLYTLTLSNPSKVEHYFSAPTFASKVYTVNVESNGAEVKGGIPLELALEPGASLEWTFLPVRPGVYQVLCPVPGHIEGGMVGSLTITPAR
jgi:uncharacterized cupredoxin-like copper-binding protein